MKHNLFLLTLLICSCLVAGHGHEDPHYHVTLSIANDGGEITITLDRGTFTSQDGNNYYRFTGEGSDGQDYRIFGDPDGFLLLRVHPVQDIVIAGIDGQELTSGINDWVPQSGAWSVSVNQVGIYDAVGGSYHDFEESAVPEFSNIGIILAIAMIAVGGTLIIRRRT